MNNPVHKFEYVLPVFSRVRNKNGQFATHEVIGCLCVQLFAFLEVDAYQAKLLVSLFFVISR